MVEHPDGHREGWGSIPHRSTISNLLKKLPQGFTLAEHLGTGGICAGVSWFADITNNTIIKIEQGENIKTRLDTLKKITKAFEVSADGLIAD